MVPPPSRVAVAAATALLGFLTVQAVSEPRAVPGRGARRLELADLIRHQDDRVQALRGQVRALRAQVEGLGTSGPRLDELRSRVRTLATIGGTGGLRGPGVVVVLEDSDAARSPTGDPNDLVIHERDIQTVVNALWGAGAEAVAVNGERLTSVSAVRCAGNTLLLHGTVHSPPYRIEAIGDPAALREALGRQPGMDRLAAAVKAFGLGFRVEEGEVAMSGVDVPMVVARPVTSS